MTIKEVRQQYNLSQLEASNICMMPLRTFVRYESDENYGDKLKRQMIVNTINDKCEITEEKGILTIESIKEIVSEVLDSEEYLNTVQYCYLFGSYSRGEATEKSDVDLFVNTSLQGLHFVGLIEALREALHKKVDLIRQTGLNNNLELTNEILRDGIKIYLNKNF